MQCKRDRTQIFKQYKSEEYTHIARAEREEKQKIRVTERQFYRVSS